MPITEVDRGLTAHAVREIRDGDPFRPSRLRLPFPDPQNEVVEIAKQLDEDPGTWLVGMERLLQHDVGLGRSAEAVVVARMTAQVLPWEPAPDLAAAKLLFKLGRERQAIRYFERSLTAGSEDPATLVLVAKTYLRLGEAENARALVERLRNVGPSHPAVLDFDACRTRRQAGVDANAGEHEVPIDSNKGEGE